MLNDEKVDRCESCQSGSSVNSGLQALEVLARALLSRIGSLSEAKVDGGSLNITYEVQKFEAELIIAAVNATGGTQRRAAQLLGMNVTTLNRKIKRYGIKTNDEVHSVAPLTSDTPSPEITDYLFFKTGPL